MEISKDVNAEDLIKIIESIGEQYDLDYVYKIQKYLNNNDYCSLKNIISDNLYDALKRTFNFNDLKKSMFDFSKQLSFNVELFDQDIEENRSKNANYYSDGKHVLDCFEKNDSLVNSNSTTYFEEVNALDEIVSTNKSLLNMKIDKFNRFKGNEDFTFSYNFDANIEKLTPEDLMERENIYENKSFEIMNFLNIHGGNSNINETVEEKMTEVFDMLDRHNIILIKGNTGCGKTTKIPRLLLDRYQSIVCTQPRRIAAISVAKKVAFDLKTNIGNLVGYSVRFDDCSSKNTRLRYVTDGVLLREIVSDQDLAKYDCIIIDEAHERTINIDILLGYCKLLLNKRKNLRVVIMSATLSSEKFINFFKCPCIDIKHKVFPLKNYFLKSYNPKNYFNETIKTIVQLNETEKNGDILVFLTGQEEIKDAFQILNELIKDGSCTTLMIYSAMSTEEQELVFKKEKNRKIILSTNICETSLTIENIVYVIDSGRVKQKRFSEALNMDILEVVMISKAQAKQRSGRAGRTQPGKVFRIYTKEEYQNMIEANVPELLRFNLNNALLTLKSIGICNFKCFKMIDMPEVDAINNSQNFLFLIKAIDSSGNITPLGRKIAAIPLDPSLSLTLLASKELGCYKEVSIIASLLSTDNIWMDVKPGDKLYKKFLERRHKFFDDRGDFFMLLHVFVAWSSDNYSYRFLKYNFLNIKNLWQSKKILEQLNRIFKNGRRQSNPKKIIEAFAVGYFMNVAKIQDGMYRTIFNDTSCYIHSSSCMFQKCEKYVLYFSLTRTKKEYIMYCNRITPEILCKCANHVFKND